MVLLASSASFDVEHSIENMAKLINPDGCLICAHIDGSIVSVLLAASALTDVNHWVKNTVELAMGAIWIPKLRQSCMEAVAFQHVKLFTQLSARLSMEVNGKNPSAASKVLKKLAKIQDKHAVPSATQVLYDAVKDTAFDLLKPDSRRDSKDQREILQIKSKKKEAIFPSVMMKKWLLMMNDMDTMMETHQQLIDTLHVVHEKYWQARIRAAHSEERNIAEQNAVPVEKSSMHTSQKIVDALQNKQAAYWQLKYKKLVAEENKLRQQLKQITKALEDEVMEHLVKMIVTGFADLSKIRKTENPFAEIDYSQVVNNMFTITSGKYICTIPPSADFCPLNMAPPRKECSDFAGNYNRSRGKVQQSNRGSYNVYMTCIRPTEIALQYGNLREGQVVKQKFLSEDGKWIFGWSRRGTLSQKVWECYPASSLRRMSI